MILFPEDPVLGGVFRDSQRRDILNAGEGVDHFVLYNDAKTDTILGFDDGTDVIDIQAWDASWDQITVTQFSLTEYRVDYLNEERLFITFEEPAPDEIPDDGMLLGPEDFIFRPGLPEATTQVIFEQSSTEREVIFGTTLPDVFIFEDDGLRDTVRQFEPGKDVIDLASYSVTFDSLRIREAKEGRIIIRIPGDEKMDKLVLIDASHQLTAEDITADMFLF